MTASLIPHGLNEENVLLFEETIASTADTVDMVMTLPAQWIGKGLIPVAVQVVDESGGPAAVGARTWQLYPTEVAAGTGIEPKTYNEATGQLTVANQTGGTLANAKMTALFVPAGAL